MTSTTVCVCGRPRHEHSRKRADYIQHRFTKKVPKGKKERSSRATRPRPDAG